MILGFLHGSHILTLIYQAYDFWFQLANKFNLMISISQIYVNLVLTTYLDAKAPSINFISRMGPKSIVMGPKSPTIFIIV